MTLLRELTALPQTSLLVGRGQLPLFKNPTPAIGPSGLNLLPFGLRQQNFVDPLLFFYNSHTGLTCLLSYNKTDLLYRVFYLLHYFIYSIVGGIQRAKTYFNWKKANTHKKNRPTVGKCTFLASPYTLAEYVDQISLDNIFTTMTSPTATAVPRAQSLLHYRRSLVLSAAGPNLATFGKRALFTGIIIIIVIS